MEAFGRLQEALPEFNSTTVLPDCSGMGDSLSNAAYNTFFVFECYHFITHMCVLFRVRLLPRKDLVRNRYYFLIDTACVFTVNFFLVQKLQYVACLQIMQHLFYFITWEKSELSKKVVTWSSLEWQRLPKKVSAKESTFEIVGTLFDTMVHLLNSYMLAAHLATVEVILGLAVVHVLLQVLLFNPRFAWSEPMSLPDWVEKRVQPLSKDLVPLTVMDKLLGQKGVHDKDLAEGSKKSN